MNVGLELWDKRAEIERITARYGASNVRIFGSASRGTAVPGSDLDILVDLSPGTDSSTLFDLQHELEALLGCKVDLTTPAMLHWYIRDRVLREAVPLDEMTDPAMNLGVFVRDEKLYLYDILERIRYLETDTADGKQAFLTSRATQDLVIRSFEIIGEAVKKLSPESTAAYPEVDWPDLARFRDVLTHQYFRVDPELVWPKVEKLPALKRAIEALLQREPPDQA